MNEDQIRKKIEEKAKDKRIACMQAMKIAEEESISTREVGRILNEMEIKVVGCQLGCFP
jgi:hypothetical protein